MVLESGPSRLNQWHQETVDFAQDYRALFGQQPGRVQGIGLMTSSTFTKSTAMADYDDFVLLKPEALLVESVASTLPPQSLPAVLRGQ